MAADFSIKRGDTLPALTGTVSDENGAVDISEAAAARLHLHDVAGAPDAAPALDVAVTIDDDGEVGTRGTWHYDWQDGDTDTPGVYYAEIEVTWGSGGSAQVQTFPNDAPGLVVAITDDLG
jgi:hypothetical protein